MWVFAYGSLMWRPGFAPAAREPARLYGWHRSLCVSSHLYRGTVERPGLVFGLDRGGRCTGMALLVPARDVRTVLAALDARELITGVYERRLQPVWLLARRRWVFAWCYVVRRDHPQYAGGLSFAERVRRVAEAQGRAGRCLDYLHHTLMRLRELGIREPELEALWAAARTGAEARGDGIQEMFIKS